MIQHYASLDGLRICRNTKMIISVNVILSKKLGFFHCCRTLNQNKCKYSSFWYRPYPQPWVLTWPYPSSKDVVSLWHPRIETSLILISPAFLSVFLEWKSELAFPKWHRWRLCRVFVLQRQGSFWPVQVRAFLFYQLQLVGQCWRIENDP